METTYHWRERFGNRELSALHEQGFGRYPDRRLVPEHDWWTQVVRYSLGWVCARREGRLVGFVNLAWDGGAHAFLLDTVVAAGLRRHGVGTRLVSVAVERARAARCEWLHVDFEPHLRRFYLDACGFRATGAGLVRL